MNAKFSEGEVVIAEFKNYPENNGEYTIIEVLTAEQFSTEFKDFLSIKSMYYRLQGLRIVGPSRGAICDAAGERSLRKKHTPSEFSFNSLMDNLKLPQSA